MHKERNGSGLGKNNTCPRIADKQIKKIEEDILYGEYEGVPPIERDITFSEYKGMSYTINRDGIVKALNGDVMKYIFRDSKTPYVVIRIKKNKNGKIEERYKEVPVIKLMDKFFGKHIQGYKNTIQNPSDFILIPQDNNWEKLGRDNLVYVNKKEYNKIGTKGLQVEIYLKYADEFCDTDVLSKKFGVHVSRIQRIRRKLISEGKIWKTIPEEIKNRTIGDIDLIKIYMLVLETNGKTSNKDIIKEIYNINESERDQKDAKWKKNITNKVVRIRRKLLNEGVIEKYNTYGKDVSVASVRTELTTMLENKKKTGKTHQEIADILGLTKSQVDNFSRTIK